MREAAGTTSRARLRQGLGSFPAKLFLLVLHVGYLRLFELGRVSRGRAESKALECCEMLTLLGALFTWALIDPLLQDYEIAKQPWRHVLRHQHCSSTTCAPPSAGHGHMSRVQAMEDHLDDQQPLLPPPDTAMPFLFYRAW